MLCQAPGAGFTACWLDGAVATIYIWVRILVLIHCRGNCILLYSLFKKSSLFYFLASPHGLWDLSSPTRYWSQYFGSESLGVLTPGPPGSSQALHLVWVSLARVKCSFLGSKFWGSQSWWWVKGIWGSAGLPSVESSVFPTAFLIYLFIYLCVSATLQSLWDNSSTGNQTQVSAVKGLDLTL